MKLIAKVKLKPTPEQQTTLLQTLERANAACNRISEIAWQNRTFNKFGLQKLCYYDIRADFNLTAQVAVRCLSKVADAYKLDKRTKRIFRPHGSIAYDSRILSWKVDDRIVSIWTVDGRQKIPFVSGPRQIELLQAQRGESDLCLIDGTFYLFATCEVDEPVPADVADALGIDMGVKNIATDSDGNNYSGDAVNGLRKRHAKLHKKLQSKGTKSAKRLLKKRRRKEKRFASDVNHGISKEIVLRAKDTGRAIGLEDLKGIRSRVTVRKAQRRQHHSWSFHQLRQFIEYKTKMHGVPVILVDPKYTSQACSVCGCVDKRNRKSQSDFSCRSCGHVSNADYNAALNIRSRAIVNLPHESDAGRRSRLA